MADEICVTVIEGKDLAVKDSCGTSDPYCKVTLGTEKFKTKKIMKNLNPRWNEKFFFKAPNLASATLKLSVWDWDRIGSDDYMGEVQIHMAEVMVLGEVNKWYPLVCGPNHQGDEVKGEINVRVQVMVQGDLQTGNLNAEELRRFALQKMASTSALPPVGASRGNEPPPPVPPRDEGYERVSSEAVPTTVSRSASFPVVASTSSDFSLSQPTSPVFTSSPALLSPSGLRPQPAAVRAAPPPPAVKPPGMAPPRRNPGSFIASAGPASAPAPIPAPAPAPPAAPISAPPPRPPAMPQAKALYAWTAENPGELASLACGALVFVKDSSNSSWLYVMDTQGNEGYIASNYVQLL